MKFKFSKSTAQGITEGLKPAKDFANKYYTYAKEGMDGAYKTAKGMLEEMDEKTLSAWVKAEIKSRDIYDGVEKNLDATKKELQDFKEKVNDGILHTSVKAETFWQDKIDPPRRVKNYKNMLWPNNEAPDTFGKWREPLMGVTSGINLYGMAKMYQHGMATDDMSRVIPSVVIMAYVVISGSFDKGMEKPVGNNMKEKILDALSSPDKKGGAFAANALAPIGLLGLLGAGSQAAEDINDVLEGGPLKYSGAARLIGTVMGSIVLALNYKSIMSSGTTDDKKEQEQTTESQKTIKEDIKKTYETDGRIKKSVLTSFAREGVSLVEPVEITLKPELYGDSVVDPINLTKSLVFQVTATLARAGMNKYTNKQGREQLKGKLEEIIGKYTGDVVEKRKPSPDGKNGGQHEK